MKTSNIFRKLKIIWKNKKNLKIQSKKDDEFNNITSAMFNAYLISTLKFLIETNVKFNKITSAMFNAYLISALKFEKIKYFWVWKSEKIKSSND